MEGYVIREVAAELVHVPVRQDPPAAGDVVHVPDADAEMAPRAQEEGGGGTGVPGAAAGAVD
eukprot:6734249-Prorocentrum_lima.AAC.1